jgi:hypothetical protein
VFTAGSGARHGAHGLWCRGVRTRHGLLPCTGHDREHGHGAEPYAQVYRAWTSLSEILWWRDENAVKSALKLLDEYEQDGRAVRLNLTLPEGVTAIAWALPAIADRVKELVKEVALDATCELFVEFIPFTHTNFD